METCYCVFWRTMWQEQGRHATVESRPMATLGEVVALARQLYALTSIGVRPQTVGLPCPLHEGLFRSKPAPLLQPKHGDSFQEVCHD